MSGNVNLRFFVSRFFQNNLKDPNFFLDFGCTRSSDNTYSRRRRQNNEETLIKVDLKKKKKD